MKYILILLLVSCASPYKNRKLTREEYLEMSSKTYKGISKDKIFKSIETFFSLLDAPEDILITHAEDGILAVNKWSSYAVIAYSEGSNTWNVKVKDSKDGIKVSLSVSTSSIDSTMSASNTGQHNQPVAGNAIFYLFFKRLNFLLGNTNQWTTCWDAVDDQAIWGNAGPICDHTIIDDNLPLNISSLEKERIEKLRKIRRKGSIVIIR